MKMRKLWVSDYTITLNGKEEPYLVKTSLCNLLFQPALQLNFRELLKAEAIAKKVEYCGEEYLYLPQADYEVIKRAIETFNNFDRFAVELVRRVEGAEEVEVEVKEKG